MAKSQNLIPMTNPWVYLLVLSHLLSFSSLAKSLASRQLRLNAGGSYKSILALQKLRDENVFDTDSVLLTEQRLRLESSLSYRWLYLEIANELSIISNQPHESALPIPSPDIFGAWDTRSQIIHTPTLQVTNRLDRAFVQIYSRKAEIKFGKLVISEGVGRIFRAISQVPRQPFVAVDPEFPVTEDAVVLKLRGSMSVDLKFLPRVGRQKGHNFRVRTLGTLNGFDVGLTGGRSDDKPYVGMEASGNLGDAVIRAEIVGFEKDSQGVIQGLLGLDRVFSAKLSGSFELFHNGFGMDSASDYMFLQLPHRSTPYYGKWYFGTQLNWEISSLWKLSNLAIVNLLDPSTLLSLSLTYSITNNIDVQLGQFLSIGNHPQSEFGGKIPTSTGQAIGLPDLSFFLFRVYF